MYEIQTKTGKYIHHFGIANKNPCSDTSRTPSVQKRGQNLCCTAMHRIAVFICLIVPSIGGLVRQVGQIRLGRSDQLNSITIHWWVRLCIYFGYIRLKYRIFHLVFYLRYGVLLPLLAPSYSLDVRSQRNQNSRSLYIGIQASAYLRRWWDCQGPSS